MNVTIDEEVQCRMAKASSVFGRFSQQVWNRRNIRLEMKIKVYRVHVMKTLLYGSETWTVYSSLARKLNHFHTNCPCRILGIKLQDKIPDTEVFENAVLPSIFSLLMQTQLRGAGHVARMEDNQLPNQLLFGELRAGKRKPCGLKRSFKDTLISSLKAFDIKTSSWEKTALDRSPWRHRLYKGAKRLEDQRRETAVICRLARKQATTTDATILCPHCPRLLLS